MSMPLLCPHCRHKFDLEQAFQEVDGCKFVELLTSLPPALVRPLYNYVKLFTPEKQAITWTKALKVLKELAPLIKEQKIQRSKVTYSVPVSVWVTSLTYLVETPPATLTKPLKSNGYLFTVLIAKAEQAVVSQAEKQTAERQAVERRLEDSKRSQEKAAQQAKEKAPVNHEFQKTIAAMLSNARRAPALTEAQKAEQLDKLKAMKNEMSDEDKQKLDAMRADRAAVEPLQ